MDNPVILSPKIGDIEPTIALQRLRGKYQLALRKNLFHCLIFLPPGGVNDTEENQVGGAGVFDVLHCVGGVVDGLVGTDMPGFAADVHDALAFENIINFGSFEAVAVRGEAGFYDGVRQAVAQVEVGFVGVQQFAQDGVIAGNERFAVLQVFDQHSREILADEVPANIPEM